ncbi:MAG TPA: DUF5680 domain-containing protein [Patescibacteria group bacterium]|nr:DUF5680 domain-containing protein [Patescibacteria group bacterium]
MLRNRFGTIAAPAGPALSRDELTALVVRAKNSGFVGDGLLVSNPMISGTKQYEKHDGEYLYRDIFEQGHVFWGLETLQSMDRPELGVLWSEHYRGQIFPECRLDPRGIYQFLKCALRALYAEGRFLGGFRFEDSHQQFVYVDVNDGTVNEFRGQEIISHRGKRIYVLNYQGGTSR